MYNKNNQKGFTLLEVLLVVVLIGIMTTLVLTAINPNRQIARVQDRVRQSDMSKLQKAIDQYKIDNKGKTPALTGVSSGQYKDICPQGGGAGCVDLSFLVPGYLSSIPKDPTGVNYKIGLNPDNNKLSLWSSASTQTEVAINKFLTPTELIQAQITEGTLVPTGTQQLVLNRLVYTNNAGNQTYIDPATTTKVCPTGYIPVPGNSMYGTNNFCVMKYEAKTGSATVAATTQAAGIPQVSINQTNAITACSLNGAGYGLINNAEWMTIARNIEGQLSNWTTGTAASTAIGTGGLYRGHSDGTPDTALEAGADNDGYIGTGNSGFSIERRTHTLSNGEVIWDLGGNVWEWTSDTILGKDQPTGSTPGFNWRQYTAITNYGTLSYDLIRPSNNTWNSTQNMGQIYSDGTSTNNTSHAFLRGGSWSYTTLAGVFTLSLSGAPSGSSGLIGFRCVLR